MAFAAAGLSRAPAVMVIAVAVVVATVVGMAGADFAADKAECADQLMGLATCLTFVQAAATARAPTPDCCAGFKQVLGATKKCLCVLVRDRDEPALGVKINVTRAMDLPSSCNIFATFSDCPKILNMSPDSKEAEIFKQYAREHESKNNGTTPASSAATGTAGGKSASTAAATGAARPRRTVFFGGVSALLVSVFVLA